MLFLFDRVPGGYFYYLLLLLVVGALWFSFLITSGHYIGS